MVAVYVAVYVLRAEFRGVFLGKPVERLEHLDHPPRVEVHLFQMEARAGTAQPDVFGDLFKDGLHVALEAAVEEIVVVKMQVGIGGERDGRPPDGRPLDGADAPFQKKSNRLLVSPKPGKECPVLDLMRELVVFVTEIRNQDFRFFHDKSPFMVCSKLNFIIHS